MKAIIDAAKCTHCPKCYVAKECPIKAVFRIADDEPAFIDMSLCHGCGVCAAACPKHAVMLREG
ncbi:4Fe-4S dicluster domain-containing protein [Candidatus Bathyarchaeota archaeon]|nr:4Fe-4S dicluster domain-containing protein [Candidatus Bathyarchaeota archaeon]